MKKRARKSAAGSSTGASYASSLLGSLRDHGPSRIIVVRLQLAERLLKLENREALPGVHKVWKPLAGGRWARIWYAWRGGGPQIARFEGASKAEIIAQEKATLRTQRLEALTRLENVARKRGLFTLREGMDEDNAAASANLELIAFVRGVLGDADGDVVEGDE